MLFPEAKINTVFRAKYVEPDTNAKLLVSNAITQDCIQLSVIINESGKSIVLTLNRESADLLIRQLKG